MKSDRLSRVQRLEKRGRKQLRCEWCNRMTPVPKRIWVQISRDENYHYLSPEEILWNKSMVVFSCTRDRCVALRPPGWEEAIGTIVWMGGHFSD